MGCKCGCYSDFISCDPDEIIIKAKLTPSTDYFYTIADKFGNQITKQFTTDANGDWKIPKTDLPADFLIEGAKFKITVTVDAHDAVAETMLLTQAINCIDVEVKCVDGEAKEFIGW